MAAKHFTGGCHCGAVRYEVHVDLDSAIACNCSRCARLGAILAFAPESAFSLISGEAGMTDYQFNKKVIHHLFCTTCGIQSFARGTMPNGTRMVAVNLRCLDGVDPGSLSPKAVDGRNF
ncbi:hypothetical protein RHODGE_RHODGE_04703 [Rhodoplanes serenus]|uniref:CENP-V/GFA domain-containing protein n=1 Tax=Rhodoplanes serenus TaxID=200615 RepID=A0A3S4B7U6_9BRAD|nr:GFA family protein [Rhodoplanes serenus]VCU11172.1 hypothetical protein RHODGE_RHODGE_04703 [Rhodoplanes serenus]